jgi:hypothetical protein
VRQRERIYKRDGGNGTKRNMKNKMKNKIDMDYTETHTYYDMSRMARTNNKINKILKHVCVPKELETFGISAH